MECDRCKANIEERGKRERHDMGRFYGRLESMIKMVSSFQRSAASA